MYCDAGLAFSHDDGANFSAACNPLLRTLEVYKVLFSGAPAYNTLVLGTSRGVYVGARDRAAGAHGCAWRLREANVGPSCPACRDPILRALAYAARTLNAAGGSRATLSRR